MSTNAIRMTGTSGALKVGYQVAARLSSWSLEHGRLTAKAEIDPFWIEQEGTRKVELTVGRTVWRWDTFDVLQQAADFVIGLHGSPTVIR